MLKRLLSPIAIFRSAAASTRRNAELVKSAGAASKSAFSVARQLAAEISNSEATPALSDLRRRPVDDARVQLHVNALRLSVAMCATLFIVTFLVVTPLATIGCGILAIASIAPCVTHAHAWRREVEGFEALPFSAYMENFDIGRDTILALRGDAR